MKLFALWIGGALIRLINTNAFFKNRFVKFGSYLLLTASLFFSNTHNNILGEYLVGISLTILILCWQHGSQFYNNHLAKVAHFFADFSFSLYAVHYFFMFLIFELCKKYLGLPIRLGEVNIVAWAYYVLIVLVIYSLAWLFYFFTERHTSRIRKFCYAAITRK
jgi:peptidoglycan/LPS O-acetylase OafA/YrhL